jgi:hypothetical protein
LLLVPGGKAAKYQTFLNKGGKALARYVGANLVGETIGQATGNETAGQLTKLGALGLTALI